ncbi:MAG: response regulator [Dehalococcoidia bacterium]|nr:response regulator [Dehalococcoidia bacterium]
MTLLATPDNRQSTAALTALVVDPNLDSRLEAVATAKRAGLVVAAEAAYGAEATFLAVERAPSIILLSLEEPPMRGLTTIEALQRQIPQVPVVAYSSRAEPAFLRRAMRAGARDFLLKPMRPDDLAEAVQAALAQERARGDETSEGRGLGTIVTVAGAKGGIGKSTLAVNLAVALRQSSGQDVALLDADVQFGDVGVMLDVETTAERCISFLARGAMEVSRQAVADCLVTHSSGVDVLGVFPEPQDWRVVGPERIARIATALAETHEYVVVDTPGTINELVAASVCEADIVLLVTSMELSSIKDTKTAVRILQSLEVDPGRIRLVINNSTDASTVTASDVAEATGLRVAQAIPHDRHLGRSVQRGVPVLLEQPGGGFSRAVYEMAAAITGTAAQPGRRSLRSLLTQPLTQRALAQRALTQRGGR